MITLTTASGTGFFDTTPGAAGVIASSGPFAPDSAIKVSYCLAGATGEYAGLALYRGNFAEQIVFPGSKLQFELLNPVNYSQVNIEVSSS